MAIIGIDLGTTNSAVAIMESDSSKIIPNKSGDNTTPSVVAYLKDKIITGKEAKNQAVANPRETISSIKRVIGLRVKEIPEASKYVSYTLCGRLDDPVMVAIEGRDKPLLPSEISSKILVKLKKQAEDYLGMEVTDAVITVPAYFNDGQRQATKQAGKLAGLNVKRIINEPTAAALAYGFRETDEQGSKIAVFDLGGGTFDISILELGGGIVEVKATNGDTFLGGDDFNREIVNLLVRHFQDTFDIDLRDNPTAMQRLRDAAEVAKHELSSNLSTKITQAFILDDQDKHLEFELTRTKFESLIEKYLKRIASCCQRVMKDASVSPNDISTVVLVGGSTRVPAVKHLAQKVFNKEPNTSVNPDEVVALGAAIQGAILSGEKKDMILVDVTPLSLGIETEFEEMDVLIPRNTPIPCIRKEVYTTTEDDQPEVEVFVYQGEYKRVNKNRQLGQFVLSGIEPALAGDPQIEVTFKIDTDGILQVSAKNVATGSEQTIVIKDSSTISESDIERMCKEAEQEADEDEDYIDAVELLETAEALLEQTDEGLEEFEETGELDSMVLSTLKTAKDNLVAAIEAEDLEAVEGAASALHMLWEATSAALEE